MSSLDQMLIGPPFLESHALWYTLLWTKCLLGFETKFPPTYTHIKNDYIYIERERYIHTHTYDL